MSIIYVREEMVIDISITGKMDCDTVRRLAVLVILVLVTVGKYIEGELSTRILFLLCNISLQLVSNTNIFVTF